MIKFAFRTLPENVAVLAAVVITLNVVPARAADDHNPADAVASLDVADGLEATLFAYEPMLLSPSNIDIDQFGRIWVCEIVNYRRHDGERAEGDRILILEDTDGDGKVDSQKVFYQGNDINSPHGVCVLGNRVIVSAQGKVFIFTDEDGDDRPDKKEILFTGMGGAQHDHGIHAFSFGPDGKLYFNFGNEGRQIKDRYGEPIVDQAGNVVNNKRQPYQEGMVFRCNLDGSEFETLGWCFRNNWMVATDSFGTIWQSDNDDDGNRGVRINFVMEFGNYGYKDEFTGAGWREKRTGMNTDIPLQHWHLRDPGVVPNVLQTGAGSPAGILVYEGDLLPEVFHNQMIHCDAGPNIVRAYPVQHDGAGYKAEIVNILDGKRDKWFRPSDVKVAPDGSLIVADWYDPGVGGHAMGDVERGRLFRVAPPGAKYTIPKFDYSTPESAVSALRSPTNAVRYLAWTALHEMGAKAEAALRTLYADANPRMRARALWLLARIDGRGQHYVDDAVRDADPDIRIVGIRLARQLRLDVIPIVERLARDSTPRVRRECLIALRHHASPKAPALWAKLARWHDGKDRWYLEALGIAADKQWDAFLGAWMESINGNWKTPAGRDIVWRSRATKTPELLAAVINDSSVPVASLPRYLRAFDFLTGNDKQAVLASLAFDRYASDPQRGSLVAAEAVERLTDFDFNADTAHKAALNRILDQARGTSQFVTLVEKLNLPERYPELLAIAQAKPAEQLGIEAIRVLLDKRQRAIIAEALRSEDSLLAVATAEVLRHSRHGAASRLLMPLIGDAAVSLPVRRAATYAVGRSRFGARELIRRARDGELDARLKEAAAAALHASRNPDVRKQAQSLFPLPPAKDDQPLPPIDVLMARKGNVARGKEIFATTGTCATCHIVNGQGKEVGPNLSEIGDKLSRQAFFQSILFPSAAISHNYESYAVQTADGEVVTGLLVSRTADAVSIKSSDSIVRTFKTDAIDAFAMQEISLMPADLQKVMSADDLIDVVAYLTTLKKSP